MGTSSPFLSELAALHDQGTAIIKDMRSAVLQRNQDRLSDLLEVSQRNWEACGALVKRADAELLSIQHQEVQKQVDVLSLESMADVAKVEPESRLVVLRIDSFLERSSERGTPRARRFDQISGALEESFSDLRAAMFRRDTAAAIDVIQRRIQPPMTELASLFGDIDT